MSSWAGLYPLGRGVDSLYSVLGLSIAAWMLRATGDMFESVKSEKVLDENCGPLSLTNVSGMPWCAKIDFRRVVTSAELVSERFVTSTYREW